MIDSIAVGTRWDAQLWLTEAHPDKDPAGLKTERVLEEIAEALFVDGPLKGRLCLELSVEVVKRGSQIAAGQQISVTGIVRAIRAEQGNYGSGEVIRVGVAVWRTPGAKDALMTGTLEMLCCESIQAGVSSQSGQAAPG